MTARIAGVASTNYGKHPGSSSRELFVEAAQEAVRASNLTPRTLDAVYCGNFVGGLVEDQGHLGALVADYLGARAASSVHVESACASGGAALRAAVAGVERGDHEVALAGGVELMRSVGIERITDALANAADNEYENAAGLTFPGIFALLARRYMAEHGVTREDLAAVAVKNHAFGVDNPVAQYHEEITVADVLDARPVATPLGLYDACPVSDGASAVVVVDDDFPEGRDLTADVAVAGSGHSGDSIALQDRRDLGRTAAAERAAERAYEAAGIGPGDVDVAEVHDCFTVAEPLALEALGFYDRGEGVRGAVEGETGPDGRLPVNTSGGLLSKGHPVGATGVGQVVELAKQLRGEHPNQVDGAEVGLAHNVGGSGASAVVHVLRGGVA